MLDNAAYVVENLVESGASNDEIQSFFYEWSERAKHSSSEFMSVFALAG